MLTRRLLLGHAGSVLAVAPAAALCALPPAPEPPALVNLSPDAALLDLERHVAWLKAEWDEAHEAFIAVHNAAMRELAPCPFPDGARTKDEIERLGAWARAREAAYERHGLKPLHTRHMDTQTAFRRGVYDLARTPARTLDGLMAKARWIDGSRHLSPWLLEDLLAMQTA